jgi:hypothetical protein
MSVPPLLNAAGRRRSPATMPRYLAGRPRNKGLRYPPDPPTVEEIVAVMRQAVDGAHGARILPRPPASPSVTPVLVPSRSSSFKLRSSSRPASVERPR